MSNPVICCIGYNRPNSMKRLLNSVGNAVYDNDDITLVISIDESDMSDEVERVAQEFNWKHGDKIIKRYPKRLGLKKHCLLCGDLSIKFGSVIFLEDDVVVAPGYYRYTKEAVEYYKNDEHVLGISLYTQKWVSDMERDFIPANKGYDTFFLQRDVSHGQCWIGEKWKRFKKWYLLHKNSIPKYDKRVPPCVYKWKSSTSWSKYISFFMVEEELYYICPYNSFATNLSEVGVHASRATDICQVPLSEGIINNFRFGTFDDSVKYDAIFERKDKFLSSIAGVPFEDICIDINGMKYDWSGYKYILTSQNLPYEKIISFGVNMEPIENNVIYNVPGKTINLLRVPDDYKPPQDASEIKRTMPNCDIMSHIFNKISARIIAQNLSARIKRKLFCR